MVLVLASIRLLSSGRVRARVRVRFSLGLGLGLGGLGGLASGFLTSVLSCLCLVTARSLTF